MNKAAWINPHKVLQLLLINTVYHLLVNNNKGEGGGLINYLHLKRKGLLEAGLLIFRAVTDLRNSGISTKSREIPPKNAKYRETCVKPARNFSKYMSAKHISYLSWLLELFFFCHPKRPNLSLNFVTATSKQRPKTTRCF